MNESESVMNNPYNVRIMKEIQETVNNISMAYLPYDSEDMELFQSNLDEILSKSCSDLLITESINETGLPDALVLSMLTSAGYLYDSINDFKKIIKVITYNSDAKTLQVSIIPTFRENVIRVVIDLEVKPKYTCNGEVIECE